MAGTKSDRQVAFPVAPLALGSRYIANRSATNNASITLIPVIVPVGDPEHALIGASHEIAARFRADSEWSPSPRHRTRWPEPHTTNTFSRLHRIRQAIPEFNIQRRPKRACRFVVMHHSA